MKTLGFLGPAGTHSEAAAIYLNDQLPEQCQLVPFPNIYSAIRAVELGKVDTCLVPVENSIEGSINITLDILANSDKLKVVCELIWGVHNHLMVKDTSAGVTKILSHAQPLAQCRDFLMNNYPDAELDAVASSAAAAQQVAESPDKSGWAAICTKRAGQMNGLTVLAENIEDHANNSTRFYQLSRNDLTTDWPRTKSLIICQIDGKDAGRLCEVLLEMATRDVNMTRIESRPARTGLGEYIFFFDVDVPARTVNLDAAIQAIRRKSIWLRNPGRFPVVFSDNK
ncbi:MAG: prephenate dehydratase [Anaerovibrio sp.]|uniref:prephenate dehydratase n=1 Tax=Anaerovibrio sp. TaxID=1872532 RepID=UPI0025FE046C|nr:prephenate dehydratase [Anaerovibrio sp.]MCR5175234.1 prephenate dehydratase [Anaerovibrio sp.]